MIATVVSTALALLEFMTGIGAWAVVAIGAAVLAAGLWWLSRMWARRQAVAAGLLVVALIVVSAATGAAADRLIQTHVSSSAARAGPATPTGTPVTSSASATQSSPAASSPSPTSPWPRAEAPIRRQAQGVSLPIYYSLDLDSTASNWGVAQGSASGWDIRGAYGVGTHGIASFKDLTLVSGTPTYRMCQEATALQRGISQEQTRDGTSFCVKTDQGRWAWVTIAAVTNSARADLNILVWEVPT
ncbi:MAG: hypothetical protein HOV79_29025 [Hamadaea sp.]|nr:hypothetical protein [Hamadaea sp.]